VIVLDTNVLSALMLRQPIALIGDWLDQLARESVWTTSITVYELAFGIELLPEGQRRRGLEEAMQRLLTSVLEGRILSFDAQSARWAGAIGASRRRSGGQGDVRDVQIAGIVAARKATLATRNVKHFDGIGIALVNPWSA
jgi:predicted nucleic acid-binding protein